MMKRVGFIAAVMSATFMLGGCEILLPLWIASEASSGSDYDGYEDDYDYDYGYDQSLVVEIEDLRGRVGGAELSAPEGALEVEGWHYGSSANFALSTAPGMAEPDEDVFVVLDVCPIDEYASGGPISDPASSFLSLSVCRGGECRDSWDSDLQVEVTDDEVGQRRVIASSTWSDGSEVSLALHYALP